jgi:hypothetical protein
MLAFEQRKHRMGMAIGSAGQANNTALSRIESDVENVKRMTTQVELQTEHIIRHARALGYFQPPQDPKAAAPTPVVTSLADALQALGRALDHCSGALNVFD